MHAAVESSCFFDHPFTVWAFPKCAPTRSPNGVSITPGAHLEMVMAVLTQYRVNVVVQVVELVIADHFILDVCFPQAVLSG
jgi:hypothetical protein